MILKNKIALVTAGGSGIGLAGARIMAKEGATVIIADLVEERAVAAAKEICGEGGVAEALFTDVGDDKSLKHLVDTVIARHKKIDILHSHAGIQVEGSIEDADVGELDISYRINIRSHFQLIKLVVPHMKENDGGAVLITSSNCGVFPDHEMVGYITTKAATVMMTEQLALDLGKYNIRVNALCPGWVDTPFNDPYESQLGGRKALENIVKNRVPLRRFGTVDEIAESILFLVSNRSAYVTGHALIVDGGEKLIGAGVAEIS